VGALARLPLLSAAGGGRATVTAGTGVLARLAATSLRLRLAMPGGARRKSIFPLHVEREYRAQAAAPALHVEGVERGSLDLDLGAKSRGKVSEAKRAALAA
jgi:hypothetical protein